MIVVALAAMFAGRSPSLATTDHAVGGDVAQPTSPTPVSGSSRPRPLAWFEDLVAANHLDKAVRAALVRLKAEGPKAPGTSPERDLLIARLIALLPHLEPRLASEVAIALVKQPMKATDAAAVLAHLNVITDPKVRIHALRKLLEQDIAVKDLVPLLSDTDPRVRAAAARGLRRQMLSQKPDEHASAENALAAAQQREADPRVREAMTTNPTDDPPFFPEDRRNPVVLPPAAERAPAHQIESVWEPSGGADDFVNRSTITIDQSGLAHVVTLRDEGGTKWHVTYDAWAWKDAHGNLIIDARGQRVETLQAPSHGRWYPDSMTITPDGTTTVIDDLHQGNVGHSTVPGAG